MSYIDREWVYCKGCGAKIVEIANGTGFPLMNYVAMEIIFDDGTKHQTPMCKTCSRKEDIDLQDIYNQDVAQWESELAKEGRSLSDQTKNRKPLAKKVIKDAPEERRPPQARRGRFSRR